MSTFLKIIQPLALKTFYSRVDLQKDTICDLHRVSREKNAIYKAKASMVATARTQGSCDSSGSQCASRRGGVSDNAVFMITLETSEEVLY